MTISIFTDEINRDSPERALTLAKAWDVSHVEVRSLWKGRFPNVTDQEREAFQTLLEQSGRAVSGVSPGFFKCLPDDPAIPRVLAEDLPRTCDWARRLGTDHISCFAFRRTDADQPPSEVSEIISQMADIVQAHGCRLVLENEASCWGATGLEAAAIIRTVGADKLSLCWDPGNAARAGAVRPFPDEYERIKDLITTGY